MSRMAMEVSAQTNFEKYGEYAISVFADGSKTAKEIWEETPQLAPYEKVRTSTAETIVGGGLTLVPTGTSRHYDIVLPNPPTDATWELLDRLFGSPTRDP